VLLLLLPQLLDFLHDGLRLLNISFLTLLLRRGDEEVNLLLQLLYSEVQLVPLKRCQLRLVLRASVCCRVRICVLLCLLLGKALWILHDLALEKGRLLDLFPLDTIVALDWILCPRQRLLDLGVDARYHAREALDQVHLVLACVLVSLCLTIKHVFQEVIVPKLTRALIVLGVRKEIVWTEAKQIELADVRIIKVVTHLQPHVQWIVPILTHELIQLLADMVHQLSLKYKIWIKYI